MNWLQVLSTIDQSAGTGAAAKDGSVLRISDATIPCRALTFAGLTAYIKKPEYGPAESSGRECGLLRTPRRAVLVQTGSRVS